MIPVYHGGGEGNVRHLGIILKARLVNNIDIGQFNNLRSKFGHLQPDSHGSLLKSHSC